MAKAKKLADKDIASFIKKVASAGRGGDTELAFLSASARDLLKKLGGAGTKNPKTGLKEYKAASRFAKARAEEAEPVGLFGTPLLLRPPRSAPRLFLLRRLLRSRWHRTRSPRRRNLKGSLLVVRLRRTYSNSAWLLLHGPRNRLR